MSDLGIIIVAAVIVLAAVYGIILYIRVIRPVGKMKKISDRISEGDFTKPSETDDSKVFGMFSDSFNTMYDELSKSRDREMALKNKELEVFEDLSRKLTNPVTGIKLTAELLRTKLVAESDRDPDGYLREKLELIYNKSDQMGQLLNSLLSTALDGFGEFSVRCCATESRVLEDMVRKYDYRHVVTMANMPFVLIHIDEHRIGQVVKNIIENSYKYANSMIDVSFLLTDDFLQMRIADHGPGVYADEIGLITNRFYRGRRAAGSAEDGAGLGLYIAKTIMEKMDGNLTVENTGDGFAVTLFIKLC